jgi:hypothetical protein
MTPRANTHAQRLTRTFEVYIRMLDEEAASVKILHLLAAKLEAAAAVFPGAVAERC